LVLPRTLVIGIAKGKNRKLINTLLQPLRQISDWTAFQHVSEPVMLLTMSCHAGYGIPARTARKQSPRMRENVIYYEMRVFYSILLQNLKCVVKCEPQHFVVFCCMTALLGCSVCYSERSCYQFRASKMSALLLSGWSMESPGSLPSSSASSLHAGNRSWKLSVLSLSISRRLEKMLQVGEDSSGW